MKWWILGVSCAVVLLVAIVSCFVKGFWKSLWGDLSSSICKHWIKLIGVLIAYVGPIVFFLVAFFTTRTEETASQTPKVAMPIIVYLVGIPTLLVYWFKLRGAMHDKLISMKTVNEVQEGKHYALLCLFETINQALAVLTLAMAYCLVAFMETIFKQASSGILVFLVFFLIGGVLCVLDASLSYAKKDVDDSSTKGDNGGVGGD